MALLKTNANNHVMKKFLGEPFMKKVIRKNRKFLFKGLKSIEGVKAEHITLLSEQSYLVTYDVELTYKNGLEQTLRLRGNRISNDAAYFWRYVYTHAKKSKRVVVPIPWKYFKKEHFMLYEEFPGKTLRDFDNKFELLKKITPEIAEKLAWIHTLKPTRKVTRHTAKEEHIYWQSVQEKIKGNLPGRPLWLSDSLQDINLEITKKFDSQLHTLCHNDFQASNLIYDEMRHRIGIIDFGNSTRYTPTLDIATYLVHTAVMTTKHLKSEESIHLQKLFLASYLKTIPATIKKQVLAELPLYEARVAADIVATTSVALKHTKNPYRILIPKLLLPVIKQKMKLLKNNKNTLQDTLIELKM